MLINQGCGFTDKNRFKAGFNHILMDQCQDIHKILPKLLLDLKF